MILFRFIILSVLLFASANADLHEVFASFNKAFKSNIDFLTTLSCSVIEAPLKLLSPFLGSSSTPLLPLFDGQSQGGNLEEQLKLLQSFLGNTANQMGTEESDKQKLN